jgi:hypothetical protein
MNKDDDLVAKQWPGFKVVCLKCNGERISLEDSRGWSDVSGSWGSLDLYCHDCENTTPIEEH